MKRVFTLYVAFAILVTTLVAVPASAASQVSLSTVVNYENDYVEVTYSSELDYLTEVMFYLLDGSKTFTSQFDTIRIGAVDYIPGEESVVQLKLDLSASGDIKTGDYKIYAIPGGVDSIEYSEYSAVFAIADKATQLAGLETINNSSETGLAGVVKTFLVSLGENIGNTDYSWMNKYLYSMKLDDCGGKYTSVTQVKKAWDAAIALNDINNAAANGLDSLLTANGEILGIDVADKDYADLKDKNCELLKSRLNDNKKYSCSAFIEIFDEVLTIVNINNAEQSELDRIFKKYAIKLGLNDIYKSGISHMQAYEKLDSDKFARRFDGFTAANIDEIKEKFKVTLDEFNSTTQNNYNNTIIPSGSSLTISGPSGGGGGGRGGSGGGSSSTVVTPASRSFKDVDASHWANESIKILSEARIINGYEDNSFRPDNNITREEFIKIIVAAFTLQTEIDDEGKFADIQKGEWYFQPVIIANKLGIINGLTENTFGIGNNITREDMATIIYRTCMHKGVKMSANAVVNFTDKDNISDYATDAVAALVGSGIINGFEDGSFMPKAYLTRAEAAKVIFASMKQ